MLVAVALSNAARFVVFVSCTRDASRRYRLTCVMEVVPCRVLSLTDDTVRWALIIETKKLPTNVSSSDVTSIATRSLDERDAPLLRVETTDDRPHQLTGLGSTITAPLRTAPFVTIAAFSFVRARAFVVDPAVSPE